MSNKRGLGIVIFVFIFSLFLLGCQTEASAIVEPPAKTAEIVEEIVVMSTPTEVPATPTPIVPTPTPEPDGFLIEDFDNEESGLWPYFVVDGSNSVIAREEIGENASIKEGYYQFKLTQSWQWAYAIFDAFEYEDVRIDVSVENRGTNNNGISLICRYSEFDGWYEFNIANNGLYYIYYAAPRFDGFVNYTELADGGSNAIKQGKDINDYTAICEDKTLTLMINGNLEREILIPVNLT